MYLFPPKAKQRIGVSNYFVFAGLVRYGYTNEAMELANKTIDLFGADIAKNGQMHEYYHPESGEGVNNPGFQSWNLLCGEMIRWKQELQNKGTAG